ncbi:tryptophan synthase subunit alpha [Streptomyces sp. NPDC050388]|uniref:tryptophan synthase subunit alpha n=1 Tax=Streptomyces sp. NPDC050388 TaxID=3155781 RepID=UPI003448C6BA
MALAEAGADLFEIGLPRHSPCLDDPRIQAAYRRALQDGHALDRTLRSVQHTASLRPTVVMTYWEPIAHYGSERGVRLFADAAG